MAERARGAPDLRERPRHGHPLWLYGVTSAQDVAVGHEPTSMLGQLMSVMQVVPGALRQRRSGGAGGQGQLSRGTTGGDPGGGVAMKPMSCSVPPQNTRPAAALR